MGRLNRNREDELQRDWRETFGRRELGVLDSVITTGGAALLAGALFYWAATIGYPDMVGSTMNWTIEGPMIFFGIVGATYGVLKERRIERRNGRR